MPKVKEKKVSAWQLECARCQNGKIHGYFYAYCSLQGSCDTCNRRVRFLCRIKSKFEDWQTEIIRAICKGE